MTTRQKTYKEAHSLTEIIYTIVQLMVLATAVVLWNIILLKSDEEAEQQFGIDCMLLMPGPLFETLFLMVERYQKRLIDARIKLLSNILCNLASVYAGVAFFKFPMRKKPMSEFNTILTAASFIYIINPAKSILFAVVSYFKKDLLQKTYKTTRKTIDALLSLLAVAGSSLWCAYAFREKDAMMFLVGGVAFVVSGLMSAVKTICFECASNKRLDERELLIQDGDVSQRHR